jgi:hypothetical protein
MLQRSVPVLTVAFKAWIGIFLLLANAFFMVACVLYGGNRGRTWQWNWAQGVFLNAVIEIVFNNVTEVLLMRYLVPKTIVEQVEEAKLEFCTSLILLFRHHHKSSLASPPLADIPISRLMFPSTIVSKAYPGLLESRIVLSCQTPVLPDALKRKLLPASRGRGGFSLRELVASSLRRPFFSNVASLWVFTMIQLGAMRSLHQKATINLFNLFFWYF